jgi:hypothetical protein
MWKWIIGGVVAVLVLILVAIGTFVWWITRGPDLTQFEFLKEPRVIEKNAERMVVVEGTGETAEAIAEKAIETLFETYYALEGNQPSFRVAPRARWPQVGDSAGEVWIGRFGLPVSGSARLPAELEPEDSGLKIEIQTWEYGQVAEILHIGPYDREEPTIDRLHRFIAAQGLEVVGEHEEEYLKGPGLLGPGDPQGYYTIIRLRVVAADT